jgi:NADH dehydrogenase
MSAGPMRAAFNSYDVVVLGAGYAGLMAALRLSRRKWQLRIALVNAREQFLERVRLQESIVAAVPSRIPSVTALVAGTSIDFIRGTVTVLDAEHRRIRIATDGEEREIAFDQAIYALGSNIDVDNVPGAGEHAYRLEAGEAPRSASALRSKLQQSADRPMRVVTVGGSETGVEIASEIKTAWPSADVSMISGSRCGGFKGPRVEKAVRAELNRLGVTLIDGEIVTEVRLTEIMTDKARTLAYDICVWATGLRSVPVARDAGLATDAQGRIFVGPNLRSISHPCVVAVGDAAYPIAPTGAAYRLSAFTAAVSGAYAADVIIAKRAKRQLLPFSYSAFGQGVAIGRRGVGFFSYPDDKQTLFILKGRPARHVRNFFVAFFIYVLRVERRLPGFFFWPGRRRVSWDQANDALRKVETAQKVQTA